MEAMMLFNSIAFLFFFPFTVLLYFLIPGRYRYIWLLFSNYVFYLSQDRGMVLFLLYSTILTWITGNIIYEKSSNIKKLSLFICVILNILPLIILKYSDFFLSVAGSGRTLNLLVPAGISFYTLQSMTYVIDCFRGHFPPEKNFFKYALFVSFFPCILSGPIERAENFLPQTGSPDHDFDPARVKEGLQYMLWGYFMKLVIVSRLEILTDLVYSNYADLSGTAVLIGVIAFSFQIYCDFAGYSFIALGAARIIGYNIICNFKQPYFAASVQEFWRRWHISLSTWFRDYLYIPLGGSKKGRMRRYLNLMIVFIVSGLWHGAGLNFLVWGALHGAYQIAGHLLLPARKRIEAYSTVLQGGRWKKAYSLLTIFITYVIVMLTWIPFKSTDLSQAGEVFLSIFSDNRLSHLFDGTVFRLGLGVNNLVFVLAALAVVMVVDLFCERRGCMFSRLFENMNTGLRWGVYYVLIIMILFSANLSTQEFLYQGF